MDKKSVISEEASSVGQYYFVGCYPYLRSTSPGTYDDGPNSYLTASAQSKSSLQPCQWCEPMPPGRKALFGFGDGWRVERGCQLQGKKSQRECRSTTTTGKGAGEHIFPWTPMVADAWTRAAFSPTIRDAASGLHHERQIVACVALLDQSWSSHAR